MSDDTPTERFESPTPTAPTAPLPAADAAASTTAVSPDEKPKRGMLIALLSIAGAILIALIIIIVMLLNNGSDSNEQPAPEFTASESPSPTPTPDDTESPEPSETPSASPSATAAPPPPPPPPQSPSFATFSGTNKATCPDTSSSVEITWSWSSANAVNAWFGIGTNNAKLQPYEQVPTTATYTFFYQCSEASQIYTVTLEDSSGRLTHKTVTISRQ